MITIKFSVLISVYAGDDSKKFERALKSVYKNTILPDQVVLVVDGYISKNLERIIEKYLSYDHFLVVKARNKCWFSYGFE